MTGPERVGGGRRGAQRRDRRRAQRRQLLAVLAVAVLLAVVVTLYFALRDSPAPPRSVPTTPSAARGPVPDARTLVVARD